MFRFHGSPSPARDLGLGVGVGLVVRLERALAWLAALLLGVALWMMGDAAWYQRQANAELLAPSPGADVATPLPVAVTEGTPLGWLRLPRLALEVVVAEGLSDAVLRRAVGRVPGGARLGERGNLVLAGHRDTFFRPLESVRAGDLVVLEDRSRRLLYRVEWAAVVEPSQVDVAGPSAYDALTLITCFPFGYVGPAPYRFVVRARRLADDVAFPGPAAL